MRFDVATLRNAFDGSFAVPATPELPDGVDLIGTRVGGMPYAIRMAQIVGLRAGLAVTPCPTPMPQLLGIAGIGGALVPVYDLAAVLGLPPGAGRWTVLVEGGSLALVFADFIGHFRVEPAAISPRHGGAGLAQVVEFASHAGQAWPVIDVPSVVAAIRRQLPFANKE
jgi:purine-binding chemotaxis protein CheW